jgi:hypothetical protein
MPKKSRRLPGGKVRKPVPRAARVPVVAPAPGGGTQALDLDDAPQPPQLAPTAPAVNAAPVRPRAPLATSRQAPQRSGRSLLDIAEASSTYIRSDLARIGILAGIMFAAIVGLSFVLR